MLAGMDDAHIINVEELRRRYGAAGKHGFEAVRGVSFSVRGGGSVAGTSVAVDLGAVATVHP